MIPRWIVDQRLAICRACSDQKTCQAKFEIVQEVPACPLNKLPSKADAIAARAWPAGVERISGCCDPIGAGYGGE